MAKIRDLKNITKESLEGILQDHENDQSLEITDFGNLEAISADKDVRNSSIKSLSVTAKVLGIEKEYHFIIKSPPKFGTLLFFHKLVQPFQKEAIFYNDLVNLFQEADGKNIMKDISPICYHASSNEFDISKTLFERTFPWLLHSLFRPKEEALLILENIQHRGSGYAMYNKLQPLPLDHVMVVMKKLAQFHSAWFRWYSQNSNNPPNKSSDTWTAKKLHRLMTKNFDKIPDCLINALIRNADKNLKTILKMQRETNPNVSARVHFFLKTLACPLLQKYKEGCVVTPVDTVCHGQLWTNNIMFSYDADEKVEDAMLIDHQTLVYRHPTSDLTYFFFTSTNLSFRDAHLWDCLKVYWDAFYDRIRDCVDEDFDYGFEEFKQEYIDRKLIGFVEACCSLPLFLSTTGDVDMSESNFLSALTTVRDVNHALQREIFSMRNPNGLEIRRRMHDAVKEIIREKLI